MSDRYTRTAIILHWVIAALVIANITLAWTFKIWPDYSWTQSVTNAHKTIGITVLGLALMRLLWRIGHRPPPFSPAIPRWQVVAARAGHAALYFMILAMPLSGWIYDSAWEYAADVPIDVFGLFEMPRIAWVANMAPEPKKALDELAHISARVAELPAVRPARGASHRRSASTSGSTACRRLQRMTFRGVERQ